MLGLALKFEDDADEYAEFDTGTTLITLFNRDRLTEFIPHGQSLSYDTHSARVVLSFQVNDLKTAISHLQAHNIEILNPPTGYPDRGFLSTCLRDPDGNLIELEQMIDVTIA
ncbi:MAG: VOC family protein [Cyanobacteria bacterium P01_H01_bin.26]